MPGIKNNNTWTWSQSLGRTVDLPAPEPQSRMQQIPESIGPYLVQELVGRGGMAAVYLCRDQQGERVAVKWLDRPHPAFTRRFATEVRTLSRLDHPAVVRYLGHGEHAGRPYLVMEYLDGEDLRLWAHRTRRLPSPERYRRIKDLAQALAKALSYIHGKGLIHRDVKPSNIRVLPGNQPVLTDFGIVKDLADDGLTAAGVVIGTLKYASPEQLQGQKVDARTDLYGLGCTLYNILLGRLPFEYSDQSELIRAHLRESPVPPSVYEPTVPPDLERLIRKLMEKDPGNRFASAEAVLDALSGIGASREIPLASQKTVEKQIATALERVEAGETTRVQVLGNRGTGKTWVLETLRDCAHRRGLACRVYGGDHVEQTARRLQSNRPLLLVAEGRIHDPHISIQLQPLGLAEVRRSLVATVPDIEDPARMADALYRATGGLAAFLVPMLERLRDDSGALDGQLPEFDGQEWLEDLDLDELEVLQVVAAAAAPVSPAQVEELAQVPAVEALASLGTKGLVKPVGGSAAQQAGLSPVPMGQRYVISAGLLADAALARAPDLESLLARVKEQQEASSSLVNKSESRSLWEVDYQRAMAAIHGHRLEEAQDLLNLLDEVPRRLQDNTRLSKVAVGRGMLLFRKEEPETAISAFRMALSLSVSDEAIMARAWHGIGLSSVLQGEPVTAARAFEKAARLFTSCGDHERELKSLLRFSQVDALLGRLASSLDLAWRVVRLARALAIPRLECMTSQHLGILQADLGRFDQSRRMLADVTALAHAAALSRFRWTSHVHRAQLTLDAASDSRTAAVAASERILRVLGEAPRDLSPTYRRLAAALLCRASAIQGNIRMFQRALKLYHSGPGPGSAREPFTPDLLESTINGSLQLCSGLWLAGRADDALASLSLAADMARNHDLHFLSWKVAGIRAKIDKSTPPAPGRMAHGLDDACKKALEAGPVFP